jgi:hypothetical protein
VIVAPNVVVIDTLIVIALGNGADTVDVADTVDELPLPRSSTASVTPTFAFPFPSAATNTTIGHVPVDVDGNGHVDVRIGFTPASRADRGTLTPACRNLPA